MNRKLYSYGVLPAIYLAGNAVTLIPCGLYIGWIFNALRHTDAPFHRTPRILAAAAFCLCTVWLAVTFYRLLPRSPAAASVTLTAILFIPPAVVLTLQILAIVRGSGAGIRADLSAAVLLACSLLCFFVLFLSKTTARKRQLSKKTKEEKTMKIRKEAVTDYAALQTIIDELSNEVQTTDTKAASEAFKKLKALYQCFSRTPQLRFHTVHVHLHSDYNDHYNISELTHDDMYWNHTDHCDKAETVVFPPR